MCINAELQNYNDFPDKGPSPSVDKLPQARLDHFIWRVTFKGFHSASFHIRCLNINMLLLCTEYQRQPTGLTGRWTKDKYSVSKPPIILLVLEEVLGEGENSERGNPS